ncbi:MAG: Npt1/Npt2 family nucleotide transporter [Myxococcota bacterium]
MPNTRVAVTAAALMIAQQVGAKATRDALFLGNYPADDLPKVMIVAAVLGAVTVLVLSSAYQRWSPARLVPMAFALNGALFMVEWWFARAFAPAVAVVVYLHVAMLGASVISGFWSVVNERYDPHSARRAVARIAAGATAGGVLGAVVTERVSSALDVGTMLLVLALFNLGCAVLIALLGRGLPGTPSARQRLRSSVETLQRSPYLQRIASLVALVAIVGTLLDFAFKAEASVRLSTEAELASFFAIFYTVTSVVGFVLQTTGSSRLLDRVGVERTLAILPWTVMTLSVVGMAFTRLVTLALVRGAEWALESSVFRSGYELLYVPIPAARKRSTKVIIDVGLRRAGDLVGSGIALFVVSVLPEQAILVVLGLATALAFLVRSSIRGVYRGYVDELASGLEAGSIDESQATIDQTTRRLVTRSLRIDRERLLARVAELRGPESTEEMTETRRRLHAGPIDLKEVPKTIELLAHPQLAPDAAHALEIVAPRVTGQLLDALLDPGGSEMVRHRIPSILLKAEPHRAAEGLIHGLADPSFRVRSAAGKALTTLSDADDTVELHAEEILRLVEREIDLGRSKWVASRRPGGRSYAREDRELIVDPTERGLTHVFTLLGLVLDREAVMLARRALVGSDTRLRGTALEYLENVLPDGIRTKLWPYVGGPTSRSQTKRSRAELIRELEKLEGRRGGKAGKPK